MKKTILSAIVLLASVGASARTLTPMHFVEKSSYALKRLVNQKQIDASYLTDVDTVVVTTSATGTSVEMKTPSGSKADNMLNLNFDAKGALASFNTNFQQKSATSPIFTTVDSATILDLGAEAIVDHLSESPDLPIVAQTAQSLTIALEGQVIHIRILLQDGRTYNLLMDNRGNVMGKGF